jgi:hypothetical protein
MPEIRTNRVSGRKPLTEFVYFVNRLEIGSIVAVGRVVSPLGLTFDRAMA